MCAGSGVANQSLHSPVRNSASKKIHGAALCQQSAILCISMSISLRRAVTIVRQCTCQAIALMVTNLKYPRIIHMIQRKITCLGAVACSNKNNSSGSPCSLSCLDAQIVCMSCGCELMHKRMCIHRQGFVGQHLEKTHK